jgi:N-acetylglucosamine kinase-like BadF-type ATPase
VLLAGIDGGQSSTTAVIGDDRGQILGRGVAGGADEVATGPASTRMHDALSAALDAARRAAGLRDDVRFAAIVAGVSGYEGRVFGKPPDLPATRFILMHDAPVAHAGALAGRPGVVIISGTGSVVYATDGIRGHTTGGWGYLFGDEGSAFWLVREVLASLMRDEDAGADGRRAATQEVCAFFGLPSLRQIARSFYAGELTRDKMAAFAPRVIGRAQHEALARRGADALAALASGAIAGGAAPVVACAGGMFGDAQFFGWVSEAIAAARPEARVTLPRYDPALGALILAYREAGLPTLFPQ